MEDKTVIRLKRSYYSDKRGGLHLSISLTPLVRKCKGAYNIIHEDVSQVDEEYVYTRITNIDDCDDGVYEITTCNIEKDFESGFVESCDYKLIPYESI